GQSQYRVNQCLLARVDRVIDDDKPRLGDFRRQLIGQVKETLQKGKTPSEK
ncbi:hypothetical protein ACUOAQ_01580, partial [Escherichia sp. SP-MK]